MMVNSLLAQIFDFVEVVTNLTVDFSTVDQEQELGFNLAIEEALDHGCGITVDLNVHEGVLTASQVFVIFLNLGAHRVPRCAKVKQSESGPLIVQVFDNIVD